MEPLVSESRRNAIVTGATGGIGRALVHAFSAAGYRVLATDREARPADLDCALYVQADLAAIAADESDAQKVFVPLREALQGDGLHALINNAAVQILGGTETLTRADWHTTLDVNLVAPFIWTQGFLAELQAVHGCVVNISSIHARLTKRNFVAYATSKAALSGMTRAMAVDLGGRVRVNAIEPAAIATEMLKAGFEGQPEQFAALEGCHPAGRIGLPSDVARAALYLCDAAGSFMHGACVTLDGGIGDRLFDLG
jgi:NAD(P)-dependent dehydrogenase (short-subunit alcohol dehydrogenase family)